MPISIKSYPRSGTNFILENIKTYTRVSKDNWRSDINNDCLNVYVIRNPKDCISSNISMTLQDEEIKDDQILKMIENETSNYIKFLHTVYKNKDCALIINFEDLSSKPYETLKSILELSGIKDNFVFKDVEVEDKKVFNYISGKFQLFIATSKKNQNYEKIKELVLMDKNTELEDLFSVVLALVK